MRYEFDRLGWLNFEWLVQTWLKAEFGFSVESWGGGHDQGRDAYSKTTVTGKSTNTIYTGPVIFQVKFVAQANARGSDYRSPLFSSCRAESRAIQARIEQGLWQNTKSYVLLTNCPVTGSDRIEVESILATEIHDKIAVLGANDLADAIDLRPEIARAYPQILSYRNLLNIIERAQAKDVFERSAAALAAAQEIIPVFVPTEAYDRAWSVLRKNHFVVLSGPPEMGKTSIGWMIAMSQVANGWQVIECASPSDVFRVYDHKSQQLFLADDAFGRTEFSVDRGALWEPDLVKVLQRLNHDHLLVWTSRKHILERAMREIDIPGGKDKFPSVTEVLVQSDKLSTKEKALILYRHAVAANLEDAAKGILKGNIETIIGDAHFTPERIRRFVRVELPRLDAQKRNGHLKEEDVQVSVEKAIEQYTEMMEKSFIKLPDEQKWILICLLDERNIHSPEKIEANFRKISPVGPTRPFEILLDELDEAFIRISDVPKYLRGYIGIKTIAWIHPSYRDLVIESISKNPAMRFRYLDQGGMPAITLALSQEGGATGQRSFPLMLDGESWDTLESTCIAQLNNGLKEDEASILGILNGAITANSPHRERLGRLASTVCETLRQKWDIKRSKLDTGRLEQFYALAERSSQYVPSPKLTTTWETAWAEVRSVIYDNSTTTFGSPDELLEWAKLCDLIQRNEPRFLRRVGFPLASTEAVSRIAKIAEMECQGDPDFRQPDEYKQEAERLNEIGSALDSLKDAFPTYADELEQAMATVESQADEMDGRGDAMEEAREPEQDEEERGPGIEIFNVHELFRDL